MAKFELDRQYEEESDLLKKVTDWLEPQRRDGIKVIRVVDRYQKGYSDLFLCVRGYFVVAELKDDTGTATPHQKIFIQEVQAAGGIGGVCRSISDVAKLIQEVDKRCACRGLDNCQYRTGMGPDTSLLSKE